MKTRCIIFQTPPFSSPRVESEKKIPHHHPSLNFNAVLEDSCIQLHKLIQNLQKRVIGWKFVELKILE